MSRSTFCCSIVEGGAVGAVAADQRDQGPVELVEHVGDHLVLLLQAVEHRRRAPAPSGAGAGTRAVLERVVAGDDPAVGLAERAQRPVVLPHRHGVDGRPGGAHARAGRGAPAPTMSRTCSSSARSPSWMSTRCWDAACALRGTSRLPAPRGWAGTARPTRRSSLSRSPGSAVGRTVSRSSGAPAAAGSSSTSRPWAGRAPRRPGHAPPAPPPRRTAGSHRRRRCRGCRCRSRFEGQAGELLGPVARRALQEPAARTEAAEDVVDPSDRLRRAAGRHRRLVEAPAQLGKGRRLGVPHARHPPVRELAGHPDHPRPVGADPDRDVVGRHRAGGRPPAR